MSYRTYYFQLIHADYKQPNGLERWLSQSVIYSMHKHQGPEFRLSAPTYKAKHNVGYSQCQQHSWAFLTPTYKAKAQCWVVSVPISKLRFSERYCKVSWRIFEENTQY